jgi:hypothetical protein
MEAAEAEERQGERDGVSALAASEAEQEAVLPLEEVPLLDRAR